MTKINVTLDNIKWNKKISKPNNYIKKRINKLIKKKFIKKNLKEFSLLLTDNKKMKILNYKYRKINKVTDVLSFPFNKDLKNENYIGDIAISFEIVNRRSKKTSFCFEFDKMWIHGFLHLLGFDHKKDKDYSIMNKLEKKFLNSFEYNI